MRQRWRGSGCCCRPAGGCGVGCWWRQAGAQRTAMSSMSARLDKSRLEAQGASWAPGTAPSGAPGWQGRSQREREARQRAPPGGQVAGWRTTAACAAGRRARFVGRSGPLPSPNSSVLSIIPWFFSTKSRARLPAGGQRRGVGWGGVGWQGLWAKRLTQRSAIQEVPVAELGQQRTAAWCLRTARQQTQSCSGTNEW